MKPLPVPPAAQRDQRAVQMLSAWIAENGLHCALNIGFWGNNGQDEAHSWGILLADLVRHIGNAVQEERGVPPEDTVVAVINALNVELDNPTSAAKGGFKPGHS